MNELIERFEEKVIPEPNSGCWIWLGSLDSGRYARIGIKGKNHKASRVSVRLYKCEDPGSLSVLHRCDMPECVNPDHLFVGTHQDNMKDRDAKGRQADRSGTRNGCAGTKNPIGKLSEDQVREIRGLFGRMSYRKIGERFGVCTGSIQKIAEGRSWRWLQ